MKQNPKSQPIYRPIESEYEYLILCAMCYLQMYPDITEGYFMLMMNYNKKNVMFVTTNVMGPDILYLEE